MAKQTPSLALTGRSEDVNSDIKNENLISIQQALEKLNNGLFSIFQTRWDVMFNAEGQFIETPENMACITAIKEITGITFSRKEDVNRAFTRLPTEVLLDLNGVKELIETFKIFLSEKTPVFINGEKKVRTRWKILQNSVSRPLKLVDINNSDDFYARQKLGVLKVVQRIFETNHTMAMKAETFADRCFEDFHPDIIRKGFERVEANIESYKNIIPGYPVFREVLQEVFNNDSKEFLETIALCEKYENLQKQVIN